MVAGGTIHEPTHYEVLGVSEDATTDEIRAAWRALIREVHPDRETDPAAKAELDKRAALINEAYTTLTDPRQRARYEAQRRSPGKGTPGPAYEDSSGDSAPGAGRDTAAEDSGAGAFSEEDEEAMWERIQREAEEEAEAAWARWENPTLSDRLSEALAELRGWEFSRSFTLSGFTDDKLDAGLEFRANRPDDSPLLTLPAITTVMAALAVGELLFAGAAVLYSGGLLIALMALAFAADLALTFAGARPLRYIAFKAGSLAVLSEGEKLAAICALAIRSVWTGVTGFFACMVALLAGRWILHLFVTAPLIEAVLGYSLALLPLLWTAAFIAIWAARALRAGPEPSENTLGE